MEKSVSQAYS